MNAIQIILEILRPEQVAQLHTAGFKIVDIEEAEEQDKLRDDLLLATQRELRGLLVDLAYQEKPEDEI